MVTSVSGNIASNVGGAGQTAASDAAAAAPVSAGAAGSAAYLAGLLAAASPTVDAGSSGLRSPINPENSEALLLLVESRLDQASAANRAGTLASRYGQAQGALKNTAGAYVHTAQGLEAAQNALKTDQAALDQSKADQTSLQGQLATADQKVTDAQNAFDKDPSDANRQALADAQASQKDISGQLKTATDAVATNTNAVATDNAAIAAARQAANRLTAALSQIATGLRVEVGRDTHAAADRSARKEIAYEDVAATGQRFRASDLDRTTEERLSHAELSAARKDGDRDSGGGDGLRLAAGLADNLAAVLPILHGFAASPPPAVPLTAALQAGGRVRLTL